jgi:hypothetical protein
MTAKNDITGDSIRTKSNNHKAYADGWDRIFGKRKKVRAPSGKNEPVAVKAVRQSTR